MCSCAMAAIGRPRQLRIIKWRFIIAGIWQHQVMMPGVKYVAWSG